MPALLIRHQVRDFGTWKHAFLNELENWHAYGSQSERLVRSLSDANEVWLLLEWDDLFRAQPFVQSDELRATLDRCGVVDQPDSWYVEDATTCAGLTSRAISLTSPRLAVFRSRCCSGVPAAPTASSSRQRFGQSNNTRIARK